MKSKLITSLDGSHTLYVPELDEHYHSINGAISESVHIFINSGFRYQTRNPLRIFEVGFGTGLNTLLTIVESRKENRKVSYTTIEKYPLKAEIISNLNYPDRLGTGAKAIFDTIHNTSWFENVQLDDNFSLRKIEGDLTEQIPAGQFDLIYFDAFGPDKQPEMWTKDIIKQISIITAPGGVFVTYSARGELKRNLRGCGFSVTALPGPRGKRHITRAIKKNN